MLTAYHLWCAESCSRNATGQWSFASILQTGSYHHYHSHFTDGILRSRVQQPAKATQVVLKPYIAAQEIWLQGVCVITRLCRSLTPQEKIRSSQRLFQCVSMVQWDCHTRGLGRLRVTCNSSSRKLDALFWCPRAPAPMCTHLHIHIHIHMVEYLNL